MDSCCCRDYPDKKLHTSLSPDWSARDQGGVQPGHVHISVIVSFLRKTQMKDKSFYWSLIMIQDWLNNCFLLLFLSISALDEWFIFFFSGLGVDTTPTWGSLSSTPTLTDRSLWRRSLTTPSTRRQAWVSSIFETLPPSPSIPSSPPWETHTEYSRCLFRCHQETREYEVSIWEGSRETFLFAPSRLFILFLYRRRSRCK